MTSWKSVLQLSSDFNTSALGSTKHYLYGWDYLVYYLSHSLHPQFQLLGTGLRGRAFSILKTLQSLRAAVQSPQQLRLSLLCVPPDPQFNDTLSEAAAMVPNSTCISRKAARLIKLIKEFSCTEMPPSHTFPQNALSYHSAAAIKPPPPPARLSSHRDAPSQAAADCRGQSALHVSLEVIPQSLPSRLLCSSVPQCSSPKSLSLCDEVKFLRIPRILDLDGLVSFYLSSSHSLIV